MYGGDDVMPYSAAGGINDMIGKILDLCQEHNVPSVFAMSRRRLAIVLKKSYKVGCVGIFSYDGAEVGQVSFPVHMFP